ncbi:MAG: flagellar biosynthesis protein FliQ [Gammaproteobacteria bacterium]
MAPESVIDVFRAGMGVAVLLLLIIILPSLIVGLVVSIFQAATQINEQTLSFLPRLLVTLGVLSFAGPWIGGRVLEYAQEIYLSIPYIIG